MCLLLISVGRSSAWLEKFESSYVEALSIHRIAGWWCVAHMVLHSITYLIRFLLQGGGAYALHELVPVKLEGAAAGQLNKAGMLNFYGTLGLTSGLILAIFSLHCVRRRMYGIFYSSHVMSALAVFLFGCLHETSVLIYGLPACSYIVERLYARCQRRRSRAQLELLFPNLLKLSVSVSCQKALVPGSRWLYIKVPCLSREWHPFSITGTDATILVKAVGDWSQGLCSLAESHSEIDLLTDGPYGIAALGSPGRSRCDMSGDSSRRASKPSLLLIAGGVGIVPYADLLRGPALLRAWSKVTLIWAVRSWSEYEVLECSLGLRAKANEEEVQVQVYITQPTRDVLPFQLLQDVPAAQMQVDARNTPLKPCFGLALQSQLVTGITPGFVLFLTLKMQDVIFTMAKRQSWQDVFTWCIARQGSIIVLAFIFVAASSLVLALPIHALQRATSVVKPALQRLQDCQVHVPLQEMQQASSQPFSFKEGRPDISAAICQGAQQGMTISVRACGPSSLLDAVRSAVSKAHTAGQTVTLQIEQANW